MYINDRQLVRREFATIYETTIVSNAISKSKFVSDFT